MTLELLAVPESLARISGLRLCPARCLGGIRPEAFEEVAGSDAGRVLGPECVTCGGTRNDTNLGVLVWGKTPRTVWATM